MKAYFIEVIVGKLGPSAIRGAILGAIGWLVAKNGLLAVYGIVSDASAHTTTIYWDKLSLFLITGLPAVTAAVIKLLNHHADQAITKPVAAPPEGMI